MKNISVKNLQKILSILRSSCAIRIQGLMENISLFSLLTCNIMKNLPDLLTYFLYDIMAENPILTAKSMFGDWAIFANWKIFIIFSGGEFFVKENNFIEKSEEKRFFYMTKKWKNFMNYYRLDETEWENREKMEEMLADFVGKM